MLIQSHPRRRAIIPSLSHLFHHGYEMQPAVRLVLSEQNDFLASVTRRVSFLCFGTHTVMDTDGKPGVGELLRNHFAPGKMRRTMARIRYSAGWVIKSLPLSAFSDQLRIKADG
jgi:hypothetical protein